MTKVEIEKRGRVAKVHPRVADMLVQRHGYLRRDMQAQQLPAGPTPEELTAAEKKAAAAKAQKAAEAAAKKAGKEAAKKAAADKKTAEAKDTP